MGPGEVEGVSARGRWIRLGRCASSASPGFVSAPPERVAEHDAQSPETTGSATEEGKVPPGERFAAMRGRRCLAVNAAGAPTAPLGLGHHDRGYRVGDDRRFRHARAPRL